MDERKDPMGLWVGSWTPKELLEREESRREEKKQDTSDNQPNLSPNQAR